MRRGRASTPLRCPRCRYWAGAKVRRPDGSVIGWSPVATYVGYLSTEPFEGWKRPPAACPECGTPLEEVSARP